MEGKRKMNIVEAQGLCKYYGKENNLVKAVDGVDFGIKRGEFVAIVGMSGSGKTTLLYMPGGLEQPTYLKSSWAIFEHCI